MALKIVWTNPALQQLEEISNYIYRILPDRIEIIEIIHGAQRAQG